MWWALGGGRAGLLVLTGSGDAVGQVVNSGSLASPPFPTPPPAPAGAPLSPLKLPLRAPCFGILGPPGIALQILLPGS